MVCRCATVRAPCSVSFNWLPLNNRPCRVQWIIIIIIACNCRYLLLACTLLLHIPLSFTMGIHSPNVGWPPPTPPLPPPPHRIWPQSIFGARIIIILCRCRRCHRLWQPLLSHAVSVSLHFTFVPCVPVLCVLANVLVKTKQIGFCQNDHKRRRMSETEMEWSKRHTHTHRVQCNGNNSSSVTITSANTSDLVCHSSPFVARIILCLCVCCAPSAGISNQRPSLPFVKCVYFVRLLLLLFSTLLFYFAHSIAGDGKMRE